MEEKDPQSKPRPGLPEALLPVIGNGSLWEQDPHRFNLRQPDPGNMLNNKLLDDGLREAILAQWHEQLEIKVPAPDVSPVEEDILEPWENKKERKKQLKKEKKILASARPRDPIPDWLEKTDTEMNLKEDPHGPEEGEIKEVAEEKEESEGKPIKMEGKRFRKALKKAKKEQEPDKPVEREIISTSMESNLSPFTRWLKGLRGSEYVHPYEDDYALDQLASSMREGISETFADLLAAQGFIDQAIDMYKQLMAKYPEKSSFFAAKIETLS